MQQSKQVVLEFLTAVQKGENDKLGGYLHPAIEWDQPGNNQVSGKKKGIGEVFGMVGKMFELSGNTLTLADIKVLTENGDSVACLLNWKAGAAGEEQLDVDNIDIYQVKDGQITAAKIYSADLALENKFWGRTLSGDACEVKTFNPCEDRPAAGKKFFPAAGAF